MAAPDTSKVFYVAGRLIKNPTNLALPPDYGGTVLGAVNRAQLDTAIRYPKIRAPEIHGSQEIFIVYDDVLFQVTLREFSDDTLAAIFPSTSIGGVSGRRGIDIPGSIPGGSKLMGTSLAGKFLFVADDIEHPSILLYNALPKIEANETSLRFSLLFDLHFVVSFEGLRDGSGRSAAVKPIADMTL